MIYLYGWLNYYSLLVPHIEISLYALHAKINQLEPLRMQCNFFIRISEKKKDTGRFSTAERCKMAGSVFHVRKNLSTLASSFDNEQQRIAVIYFRMTFARTVNITCTYDTQCSIIRLVESIGRQAKRAECSPTSFLLNS